MQVGKATLKQVGDVSVRSLRNHGAVMPATFFVNEQASLHLSILEGSQKIAILAGKGTRIRGDLIRSGDPVKNVHVTILRPGTVKVQLHVPAGRLAPGQKYRLRVWAIDPDGNKTVGYIPFTG